MDKIEIEPVPPVPPADDTPELRLADLMGFGVMITRDGKRVDPLDFYVNRPNPQP